MGVLDARQYQKKVTFKMLIISDGCFFMFSSYPTTTADNNFQPSKSFCTSDKSFVTFRKLLYAFDLYMILDGNKRNLIYSLFIEGSNKDEKLHIDAIDGLYVRACGWNRLA